MGAMKIVRIMLRLGPFSSRPGALEDVAQGCGDGALVGGVEQFGELRAGDQHVVVVSGQSLRTIAEGLTQEALDAVAHDRPAEFLGHRQAETRLDAGRPGRLFEVVQHQEPRRSRSPLAIDALEVAGS